MKTLSDYMIEEGLEVSCPKSLLQQALQANYITNGKVWMEALKKRNNIMLNYDALVMDEQLLLSLTIFILPLQTGI